MGIRNTDNKVSQEHTATTYIKIIAEHALHYRVVGNEQNPPLVLIHGYGNSGHIWQYALPHLSQHYQLFIIDLPGFGRSKVTGRWQLQAMAPVLAAWLREIHLPPVTLMGHSMGGAIAIHLTAYAPELIEHLVLVSTAGLPFQSTLPRLMLRSLRSFLQWGNGNFPPAMLRDMLQPRLRLLWQSACEMHRSDFRAEVARIQIPTLIIWGQRDVMIPITAGLALHKALPSATFVTMSACGHRPMLSQPAELSEIVLDFLQRNNPTTTLTTLP